jgi:hypothetical protein
MTWSQSTTKNNNEIYLALLLSWQLAVQFKLHTCPTGRNCGTGRNCAECHFTCCWCQTLSLMSPTFTQAVLCPAIFFSVPGTTGIFANFSWTVNLPFHPFKIFLEIQIEDLKRPGRRDHDLFQCPHHDTPFRSPPASPAWPSLHACVFGEMMAMLVKKSGDKI